MNKELAKILTTALVQFVDRTQPENKMSVSSIEAEEIERCFTGEKFDRIEDWYSCRMKPELTEFEDSLRQVLVEALSGEMPTSSSGSMSWAVAINDDGIKTLAPRILALAKKELLSHADESNPTIEAKADLERAFSCNPDKLPIWLKEELGKKHLEGYIMGRNDALREMSDFMESHFNTEKKEL